MRNDLGLQDEPVTFFSDKEIIVNLCKSVENDPIGCTVMDNGLQEAHVLKTLRGYELIGTIAHEAKHVSQGLAYLSRGTPFGGMYSEADAYAYGTKIADKFCPIGDNDGS